VRATAPRPLPSESGAELYNSKSYLLQGIVVGKKHWIWGSHSRSTELVSSRCALPAQEA